MMITSGRKLGFKVGGRVSGLFMSDEDWMSGRFIPTQRR